jgi:hypothetical protein
MHPMPGGTSWHCPVERGGDVLVAVPKPFANGDEDIAAPNRFQREQRQDAPHAWRRAFEALQCRRDNGRVPHPPVH